MAWYIKCGIIIGVLIAVDLIIGLLMIARAFRQSPRE